MTTDNRPTKSEIFTAYNHARAAVRKAGNDPKQVERLNKALGILLSKSYYEGEKAEYAPSIMGCGCKDWQYKHAARRAYHGPCKHMEAERMLLAIQERRVDHTLPASVSPFVAHAQTLTSR